MQTETPKPVADAAPEAAAAAAEAAASADPASGAEALMAQAAERIRALEAELAEMKDRWLRAEAETQNVRVRAKRDVEDARNFAVQKFARDIVEVAETLDRALAALPPPVEGEAEILAKLREGVAATARMFLATLERHGVQRHEAAGVKFDPELHQAMAEAPSPTVPAGHVAQAWTPAWTLNGRLLKPAMVVVSTGGPAAATPEPAPPAGGSLDATV